MVFEVLPKGAENAVPPADLAARLGLSSTRQLRTVIARERQDGALILSTFDRRGGYFRPADGEQGRREIMACYRQRFAHAIAMFRCLRPMRQALDIPAGQLALEIEEAE